MLINNRSKKNPLTLSIAQQNKPILGSFEQFALDDSNHSKKMFNHLIDENISLSKRKKAFFHFLTLFESEYEVEVMRMLNSDEFSFESDQYQGLATILIHTGDVGVLLFMQQLQNLKKNKAYDVFSQVFLAKGQPYTELMTPQGIDYLERLSTLNGAELDWWQSLVEQHQQAGARVNFIELFGAYSYFLSELKLLDLGKLPSSSPFKQIKNMKVSLARALYILKNAPDKEEQLACLSGLDFGPNGAYYACRYNQFKLVSKEMNVTPKNGVISINPSAETRGYKTKLDLHLMNLPDVMVINPGDALPDVDTLGQMPRLIQHDGMYYMYAENDSGIWRIESLHYEIDHANNLKPGPTLIKTGANYFIYGSDESTWRLMKLELDQAAIGIDFSVDGVLDYDVKYKRLYETIYDDFLHRELDYERIIELDYSVKTMRFDKADKKINKFDESIGERVYTNEELREIYYRYVGEQKDTFSFDTYQKIDRYIDKLADPAGLYKEQWRFLAAKICTGPKETPSADPSLEFAAFIKTLLAVSNKFSEDPDLTLGTVLSIITDRLVPMKPDSIPSVSELSSLLNLIGAQPTSLRLNTMLHHALVHLEHHGELTYVVLNNYAQRVAIEEEQTTQIITDNFELFIAKQNAIKFDGVKSKFEDAFIVFLSLINDETDDSVVYAAQAEGLRSFFVKNLDEKTRYTLLLILNDINIAKSDKLPSTPAIIELIMALSVESFVLSQMTELERRTAIIKIINDKDLLPDTKIGKEPDEESKLSLLSVFKDFFTEYDVLGPIDYALDNDCDLISMSSAPTDNTLNDLPIQSNAGYIRVVRPEDDTCDIFFMPLYKAKNAGYRDCYIWDDETEQLSYIGPTGDEQAVIHLDDPDRLSDRGWLSDMAWLEVSSSDKYTLSKDELDYLITSNGGHVRDSLFYVDRSAVMRSCIPLIINKTQLDVFDRKMQPSDSLKHLSLAETKQIKAIIAPIKSPFDLKLKSGMQRVLGDTLGSIGFNYLKNKAKLLKTALEALKTSALSEDATEDDVLLKLTDLEATIKAIYKNLPVTQGTLKEPIHRFCKRQADKDAIDAYLETQSLSPLINLIFEGRLKVFLEKSMKVLKTGDRTFDKNLVEKLGILDNEVPVVTALKEYGQRYDALNGFINALIRLRNTVGIDFKHCVSVLNNPPANLTRLSVIKMTQLLAVLSKQHRVPVSEQLTIVMAVLRSIPSYDPETLDLDPALKALNELANYQDILGPEASKTMLNVSFKHHLTQKTPFPLKDMVALRTTAGIDPELANALFDGLVKVIERAGKQPEDANTAGLIMAMITQTTALMNARIETTPAIVPLIKLLLDGCITGTHDELTHYIKLLSSIPPDKEKSQQWIIIFSALGQQTVDLAKLAQIQQQLTTHVLLLEKIAGLFVVQPYPDIDKLIDILNKPAKDVASYIELFDLDPKGVRQEPADLDNQFSVDRVETVVTGIRQLTKNDSLSESQQFDLAQQFIYMNAIGRDKPLVFGRETYANLTKTSRTDLGVLSSKLIKALRAPGLGPHQERTLQLKLLAVMREQYFRATGYLPYSTQMLSLLLSLDNPENLLMQINTGEGKSITTAMLAALQWVKGGTITVCTADRGLVQQDYNDKGAKYFFDGLGIPSAVVLSDSPRGTIRLGGINYTTLSDMSLYRSEAKINGEPLSEIIAGKETPHHLILDECDYSTLDDSRLFNYTISADESSDSHYNPYAWVYPLINEFIDLPAYELEHAKGGWDELDDIRQLKQFLDDRVKTTEQRTQLSLFSDTKLNRWLDEAADVHIKTCKVGRQFSLSKETRVIGGIEQEVSIAIPVKGGLEQIGSTLEGSRQQFLHARLMKEDGSSLFPIDAEMLVVATESAKGFIDYYREHQGRIIGITGTAGTPDELIEQEAKFGMVALDIPPHKKNKRDELPTRVKGTSNQHDQAIIKAVSEAEMADLGALPVLVNASNLAEATALFNQLKAKYGDRVQLISTDDERNARQEKAGQPNMITVSIHDLDLSKTSFGLISLGARGYDLIDNDILGVEHVNKAQPVLLISEDMNKAKALCDKLIAKYGKDRVQLISNEDERKACQHKAGFPNMITVSTPMLGRGTDIDPKKHPGGLYVIQTYLDTPRNTRQIIGRAARNGKVGKYLALFELNGLPFGYSLRTNKDTSKKMIERLQQHITQNAAVQRHFIQEVDGIQQVLLKQFDAWWLLLHDMYPDDEHKKLDPKVLLIREKLIDQIKEKWTTKLDESDPEKKYTNNRYIRRNKEDKLDTAPIAVALKKFETEEAPMIWAAMLTGACQGK